MIYNRLRTAGLWCTINDCHRHIIIKQPGKTNNFLFFFTCRITCVIRRINMIEKSGPENMVRERLLIRTNKKIKIKFWSRSD